MATQTIRDTFDTSLLLSMKAAVNDHFRFEQPVQLGQRRARMHELSCFCFKSKEILWEATAWGCASDVWQCYAVTRLSLHKFLEGRKNSGTANMSIGAL